MQDETDKLIQEVIRRENEVDLLAGESPISEMLIQNFRGRRRWLSIVPMIESFVFLGLGIWCAYEFFQEETTKYQIAWACGFMLAAGSMALCKIAVWGEWHRNSLARELKRLEIVVADLRRQVGS